MPTTTERISDGGYRLYKAFINKIWYPFLTRRLSAEEVTFLNYGYEDDPPLNLRLDESDQPNRYSINLYHQVATQVDLTGKKLLEASCGHGGGASYLTRTLKPASYTGLDYNPDGIAYCQRRQNLPGLEFVHGDAENLPFPDESFDAVINVEASHAYPQLSRFLGEVARVLRPGGSFLYADFRGRSEFPGWDGALAEMPLRQVSKRVINDSVVRSLDNNAQRSLDLISHRLPAFLRPFSRHFAGVPGTGIYNIIHDGAAEYRIYHFTKD
jgi:ubiquinone/menaquinone biosynthesis C-methylase UbiE